MQNSAFPIQSVFMLYTCGPLKVHAYVSNANMRFLFLSGRQWHASSFEGRRYGCSLVQGNDGSDSFW